MSRSGSWPSHNCTNTWNVPGFLSNSEKYIYYYFRTFFSKSACIIKLKNESAIVCGCKVTHLKSPLLLVTLSAGQYDADVSRTTISICWEVLPRELVTRHSQIPAMGTSMLERITSLEEERRHIKLWKCVFKMTYPWGGCVSEPLPMRFSRSSKYRIRA